MGVARPALPFGRAHRYQVLPFQGLRENKLRRLINFYLAHGNLF